MFSDFPLADRVLAALEAKGFSEPTPIQAQSLPHSLNGHDILGQARTGTGKTLAFGMPIAHQLQPDSRRGRNPRAFVVVPTRELALQVANELTWVCKDLKVISIYGGTGYGSQAQDLKRGCDVVVATPGRAIDYLNRGILKLTDTQIAVLDEADEMLSMGFEEDVESLLAAMPEERQTLLFSATLPAWAKKIASRFLSEPIHINVMTEEEVSYEEVAIEAGIKQRLGILSDILHAHYGEKTIVFTHTKAEVDQLAQGLGQQGHAAEAIHGDLSQSQRERVIARFRSGQVSVLIGTNVAARGLDIPEVDLVIHYRIPRESEAYQHRSGRTGRAGREGKVILLHGPKEKRELEFLERTVKRRFDRGAVPTAHSIQSAKLEHLIQNAREQSQQDKEHWLGVAYDLINDRDSDTLAGLFALLIGGAPKERSLLTGEEGWLTLQLTGKIENPGKAVRLLREAGAKDIGRISLSQTGAYVDVRPDKANVTPKEVAAKTAQAPLRGIIEKKAERNDKRGKRTSNKRRSKSSRR